MADELEPTPAGRSILHPDPRQLRVLAHPLRARLLGALRFHGPATATQLAGRLGTNSGATSYHLRQLAEVGLVEDDAARSTGRDRAWRSIHDSTSWRSTDYDDDPDARAADEWIARHQASTNARWLDDWLTSRNDWPVEWRDAADQSDYHFTMTAEQLSRMLAEVHDVLGRHLAADDPSAPAAERVTVMLQAFPSPERRS